jgi:hypothetical protein
LPRPVSGAVFQGAYWSPLASIRMNAAHLHDEINPFATAVCGPYAEFAVEDYRLWSLLAPGRDGSGRGRLKEQAFRSHE